MVMGVNYFYTQSEWMGYDSRSGVPREPNLASFNPASFALLKWPFPSRDLATNCKMLIMIAFANKEGASSNAYN